MHAARTHNSSSSSSIYARWLKLRNYLSASTNLYIHPEHGSHVTHFETLFSNLPKISPKHVIIYNGNTSGRWTYKDDGGVLVLYASPFDVIIHHPPNNKLSLHSSTIWMKDIIFELLKSVQPGVKVTWKHHDDEVVDGSDDDDDDDEMECSSHLVPNCPNPKTVQTHITNRMT